MRRRLLTLFAVAMTAITLLVPSFASAAQPSDGVILDESNRSARSDYFFKRGCIETHINVFAHNWRQDWTPDADFDETSGGFSVDSYNTCTDEPVIGIEYSSDELQTSINQNFNGASVRGDVIAHNYINEGSDVRVKLNVFWVPAGRVNSTSESAEIMATLPGGEQVPAIQDFTSYERRAIALGTITVGNQFFPLFDRDDDTVLFGYDNTWTMIAQE